MVRKVSLFVLLLIVSSLMSAARLDESARNDTLMIPLEEWERDERVDKKVYKIAEELEQVCIKYKDDPEAIGWSPVAAELVNDLKKLGELALPAILDVAKDTSRNVELRKIMMSELGFSYNPAVIKPLINFLQDKTEDPSVRYNVADLLGRILKDTSSTNALIETMEDKSNPVKVRWEAAHSFVFIHDERAIQPLLNIIKTDPSIEVKRISISALGAIGTSTENREMVSPLLEIVESGDNPILQYHAISSLGAMKESRVIPLLEEVVKSKDRTNISVTIWALGNIGGSMAKDALLELLKDEKEGIRFDAAKALIKMGDKSVIPEIEKVISTLNKNHSNMISKSLDKLKRSNK